MLVKLTTNHSKLKFVEDRITVQINNDLSIYGIEVCRKKDGSLFIRNGESYKDKNGEWQFNNHTFISPALQAQILELYKQLKQNSVNTTTTTTSF